MVKAAVIAAGEHKRLVVMLAGALAMGGLVAGFAQLTDMAQAVFWSLYKQSQYIPLVMTPLIFAVAVYLTQRFVPAAAGSGVPQTLAAQLMKSSARHTELLGPRVVAGKILLVVMALLAGASLGREGPCVQVGAALMLIVARMARAPDRGMFIMAGAAAGFAAAFNAPLAGIAFMVEEMARGAQHKGRLTVLAVILAAGIAATVVTGDYDYFGHIRTGLTLEGNWFAIIVTGVACGIAGGVFNLLITKGRRKLGQLCHGFDRKQPVVFAAACGLALAVLGIATGGVTFGSGYEIGHGLLHAEVVPTLWHPFAKMAATVISVFSGIPGGTIAPSLSIGATIGGALTPLFPDTPVSIIVLLSLAGYFAAFTQSPLTAAVIALELTGKANAILPLLAVAVLSAAVSRLIFRESIFHFLADGIAHEMRNKK